MRAKRVVACLLIIYLLSCINMLAVAEEYIPPEPVNQNNGQAVQMQKPLKIYINHDEYPLRFLAFIDSSENA